jgi:hypothetical protein
MNNISVITPYDVSCRVEANRELMKSFRVDRRYRPDLYAFVNTVLCCPIVTTRIDDNLVTTLNEARADLLGNFLNAPANGDSLNGYVCNTHGLEQT